MSTTPPDDSWGTSREGDEPVAGYRLERLLGRGNFGEVWRSKAAGVHCALKIVRLGGEYPEVGDREVRSLQLVKRLAHTRICQIQGIWIKDWRGTCLDIDNIDKAAIKLGKYQNSDGTVVLDRQQPPILLVAMRLAQQSLYDLLKSYRAAGKRGIPVPELLGYMRDAARGLDYLHDPMDIDGQPLDAVVHCDIKPQNILKHLDEALIGDLGIARRWDRATGMTYKTEGVPNFLTPFYAAPELWSDRPVPSTDQYALAITFYQCLTDRLPFTLTRDELRDRTQIMMAHVGGRLRFKKHLEQLGIFSPGQINRLNDAFHQATLPDVAQRFESCAAFMQAIEQALAPDTTSGSSPALGQSPSAGSGEHAPPAGSGSGSVARTAAPIATVMGSGPAARRAPADLLANTSAMPPRSEVDTDKTAATVAHGEFAGDISDSLTEGLTTGRPGARVWVRAAAVVAVAAIAGVAAWQFWPRTPGPVDQPAVASADRPPSAEPENPSNSAPALGGMTIKSFLAQLDDIHRMIDGQQFNNAEVALNSLKLPEGTSPQIAALKQIAEARLRAWWNQWAAAEIALAGETPALDALSGPPVKNELPPEIISSYRALGEMLAVICNAQWLPPNDLDKAPTINSAMAGEIAAALLVEQSAPLDEKWQTENKAVDQLANTAVQVLIDDLWTGESPSAPLFGTVSALLHPPTSKTPGWQTAVRAQVASANAGEFAALEALVVLSGQAPRDQGPTITDVLRQMAGGKGVPKSNARCERLAVLVPAVAATEQTDATELDLALTAFARLTTNMLSPSPAVHQARGRLMSQRLWLSTDGDAPEARKTLFAQCEKDRWESALRSGGEATVDALALLETFAAETTSLDCADDPRQLPPQARAAADWIAKNTISPEPSPEYTAYRAYVEDVIASYYPSREAAAQIGDKLSQLFVAGQELPASLTAPDRTARAASRLVRCGERIAGLEGRDSVELNHVLDDLSWSLPDATVADRLVTWLTVAARLAPPGATASAGGAALDDGLKRELLMALALATRPETLADAATRAQSLVEERGLRNTQLLLIQARAAVTDFEAARQQKPTP